MILTLRNMWFPSACGVGEMRMYSFLPGQITSTGWERYRPGNITNHQHAKHQELLPGWNSSKLDNAAAGDGQTRAREAEQQSILTCLCLSPLGLSCLVGGWLVPTASEAGHSLAMSSLLRRPQLLPALAYFLLHICHKSPAFSCYSSDKKLLPLLQAWNKPFPP